MARTQTPAVETAVTPHADSVPIQCPARPCGSLFGEPGAAASLAAHMTAKHGATTFGPAPDSAIAAAIAATSKPLAATMTAAVSGKDATMSTTTTKPIRCRNHAPGTQPVFASQSDYLAHRAADHGEAAIQAPTTIQAAAWPCGAAGCGERFATMDALIGHVNETHAPAGNGAAHAATAGRAATVVTAGGTAAATVPAARTTVQNGAAVALPAGVKPGTLPGYAYAALVANGAPMTVGAIVDAAVAAGMAVSTSGRDQTVRSMSAMLTAGRPDMFAKAATRGAYGLVGWPDAVMAAPATVGSITPAADRAATARTNGHRASRTAAPGPDAAVPLSDMVATVRRDVAMARVTYNDTRAALGAMVETLEGMRAERAELDARIETADAAVDAATVRLAHLSGAILIVEAEKPATVPGIPDDVPGIPDEDPADGIIAAAVAAYRAAGGGQPGAGAAYGAMRDAGLDRPAAQALWARFQAAC